MQRVSIKIQARGGAWPTGVGQHPSPATNRQRDNRRQLLTQSPVLGCLWRRRVRVHHNECVGARSGYLEERLLQQHRAGVSCRALSLLCSGLLLCFTATHFPNGELQLTML
jgi:hypothetical protein